MNDLPPNSSLSRYFGNLQTMETWLGRLGGFEVIQAGTKNIAALPFAYHLNFDEDHYDRIISGQTPETIDRLHRDKFIPTRFEATKDSRTESVCALARSVLGHFNQASDSRIYLYQPKPGQAEISATPHYCIRHNDPWHDHASRELIDFTGATQDSKEIVIFPFDQFHVHLIHPELIR